MTMTNPQTWMSQRLKQAKTKASNHHATYKTNVIADAICIPSPSGIEEPEVVAIAYKIRRKDGGITWLTNLEGYWAIKQQEAQNVHTN